MEFCESFTFFWFSVLSDGNFRRYRFMEMYYRRGNGAIETVVVLLPNIWAALPSRKEWEEIQRSFKDAFAGDLREAHGSVEDSNVVPSTSENSPNRRESRDSEERREDTETAAGSTVTIPVPADSSGEQRMDIDEPKHTDDVTKQAETRSPVMKMEVADLLLRPIISFLCFL